MKELELTPEIIKAIAEEAESEASLFGFEFKNNYKGRLMYGKTCCGVICKREELQDYAESVAYEFVVMQEIEDDTSEIESQLTAKLLEASSDSMGVDTIFYWPWMLTNGGMSTNGEQK